MSPYEPHSPDGASGKPGGGAIEYISQIVTPFGIDLPPRTSTDRIDALCAEVKCQREQLRILGELVEALHREVERLNVERQGEKGK